MKNCENCKCIHNGEFGSGRFCSTRCAKSFSTKEKRVTINKVVSEKLKKFHTKIEYTCEKCGLKFEKNKSIKKWRKIHCDICKRNVVHVKENPLLLTDLSKRTISKILKRAKIKCVMCGWDKTSLDIHHIIHKKNKGTNENSNLVCLCPNCHRLVHEGKYTTEELLLKSIDKLFINWMDYYHPSN